MSQLRKTTKATKDILSSRPAPSRATVCPALPPELWIRILTYHADLTHLWTTCRRVSSSFRAYTEQVFAETHLRNTFVDFQLEKYNLGGKSRRPEIPTSFARFSVDREKELVWFKDKRSRKEVGGGKKGEYEKAVDRWNENVIGVRPEMPNYTITIGNMVNDTALPGLSLNMADREVCINWREMYQAFFKEQDRLRALKRRWNVEIGKKLEANRQRLAKGEKLTIDDLPKSWQVVEIGYRKKIRRERLKEHYKDDEERIWAIDSLRYYDESKASDGKSLKALSEIPGAGLGEIWFGSTYLLQSLYLDEWSCLHRIDTKRELLDDEVR